MQQFGLLGKHLEHSISQTYFSNFFTENKIDAQYQNYSFENWLEVEAFLANTIVKGFNVTMPYKISIFDFVKNKTVQAKVVGAVNCLKKNKQGEWCGHNTDVAGFEKSFVKHLQSQHSKALILGNGGAAQAVKYVLKKLSIPYAVVCRTPQIGSIGFADVDEQILQQYSILINTTPLGMFPHVHSLAPLPYQFIGSQHYLFDLVYNPSETVFLQHGKNVNAVCVNGLEMLIAQAEAAWDWWQQD
jgi:shikimate dehydrogenase